MGNTQLHNSIIMLRAVQANLFTDLRAVILGMTNELARIRQRAPPRGAHEQACLLLDSVHSVTPLSTAHVVKPNGHRTESSLLLAGIPTGEFSKEATQLPNAVHTRKPIEVYKLLFETFGSNVSSWSKQLKPETPVGVVFNVENQFLDVEYANGGVPYIVVGIFRRATVGAEPLYICDSTNAASLFFISLLSPSATTSVTVSPVALLKGQFMRPILSIIYTPDEARRTPRA